MSVLGGRRRARKIDRLDLYSNDVFLHVRKYLSALPKVFIILDPGLEQRVNEPIKFSLSYGIKRHSFCKQAEQEAARL